MVLFRLDQWVDEKESFNEKKIQDQLQFGVRMSFDWSDYLFVAQELVSQTTTSTKTRNKIWADHDSFTAIGASSRFIENFIEVE